MAEMKVNLIILLMFVWCVASTLCCAFNTCWLVSDQTSYVQTFEQYSYVQCLWNYAHHQCCTPLYLLIERYQLCCNTAATHAAHTAATGPDATLNGRQQMYQHVEMNLGATPSHHRPGLREGRISHKSICTTHFQKMGGSTKDRPSGMM
jgi:hypothetical protein